MITADTSVVIAVFATWHKDHSVASARVNDGIRLPAHVIVETFSVLTRLPPPHRAPAGAAEEFLARQFSGVPLVLPARRYGSLLRRLVGERIRGGAVYDALIGATANHASAKLLTLDRRAAPTYQRIGTVYELLG